MKRRLFGIKVIKPRMNDNDVTEFQDSMKKRSSAPNSINRVILPSGVWTNETTEGNFSRRGIRRNAEKPPASARTVFVGVAAEFIVLKL